MTKPLLQLQVYDPIVLWQFWAHSCVSSRHSSTSIILLLEVVSTEELALFYTHHDKANLREHVKHSCILRDCRWYLYSSMIRSYTAWLLAWWVRNHTSASSTVIIQLIARDAVTLVRSNSVVTSLHTIVSV